MRTRSSLLTVEEGELPKVLRARVHERLQRAHARSSYGLLEITHFVELRLKSRIRVRFEACLTHQQHSLGADTELGAKSEQAHHIDDHLRRVARAKTLQITAHRRVRDLPGPHHPQQLLVSVEAGAEPAFCLALAPLK